MWRLWRTNGEPTFEDLRRRAITDLSDARLALRTAHCPGTGPTRRQAERAEEAYQLIVTAMAHLDRAARQWGEPLGR